MERQTAEQITAVAQEPQTEEKYEITALGWLLLALAALAIGFILYLSSSKSETVGQSHTMTAPIAAAPAATLSASAPASPITVASTTVPAPQPDKEKIIVDLKAELEKERKSRTTQASASKALAEELQRRISEFEERLKNLNARIAALPTTTAPAPRAAVITSSQDLQKAVTSAKASAVDVTRLPIDFVTPQSSGISGFAKDGVNVGNQRIALGQKLPSGETVIAVDPETRTVVTEKRILNVTN